MFDDESTSEETASSHRRSSPVSKRCLRFSCHEDEIHHIPHINDLSDDEVKQTWYDRSDYEKIKMSLIPLVRKMMKGERVEETNRQTIRGLEYRTREGAIRRQHNKAEAITTVMDEQDRQLGANGRICDELLREVYIQINAHCQEEAYKLGLGDVEPAMEHCADVQQMLNFKPGPPVRKSSFSKIFEQMRIRRRQPVYERQAIHDQRVPVNTSAA